MRQQLPVLLGVGWGRAGSTLAGGGGGGGQLLKGQHVEGSHTGDVAAQLVINLQRASYFNYTFKDTMAELG